MKETLAIDPDRALNVFTVDLPSWLAGAATFPWTTLSDPRHGGIVADYAFMPGGGGTIPGWGNGPKDLGDLLVHEVGHHLGLCHTFEYGCHGLTGTPFCSSRGDAVCDTPQHIYYSAGECPFWPPDEDICDGQPAGLEQPVYNYMNYTDDNCRTEFTEGQHMRMDYVVQELLPALLAGGDVYVDRDVLGASYGFGTYSWALYDWTFRVARAYR